MGKSRKKARKVEQYVFEEKKDPEENTQVVPMPEIVMSRQAVLPLKDSADKTSTLRPVQKKDRRKLRHQQWLQKLERHWVAQEANRLKERRKKTAVVGDLQPLLASLPNLASIPDSHKDKLSQKYRKFKKENGSNQGKLSVLSEVDHFQKVLDHSAFKEDPFSTISQHITNAVAQDLL